MTKERIVSLMATFNCGQFFAYVLAICVSGTIHKWALHSCYNHLVW